ncbi:MAG: Pyridine nucleotide-disulfide oxidoreductase associated with reductive pyrimidine catabolism [Cyanobacteria bacterium RYN_339]|nr:Pyridine nucleotide-disulfide oxidoreductase associated with reductive pyrimidine catabolism [Cyanobacteria bacterium RYN_339]
MSDTSVRIDLPANRLERQIPDLKPPLSEASALAEANRCLYCYDAPCIQACPTAINIPEFIKRIATGNTKGAAKTILESNILGHSCARVCPVEVLCAGACVYNDKEEPPIMIGRLQRYATQYAYDRNLQFFKKGAPTGRKIALVGGGPASVAAAHELTRLGHACTVLEGRATPGGLNTTGVAPYKLHAEDSLEEIAYVQQIGFEIKTNTWVGKDVAIESLLADYDAVFLGIGLGADSRLGIPGEDTPGCTGAVAWIERMKNEPSYKLEGVTHAVVVGGGNTAIDVARELLHLGVPCVSMAYRRDEKDMSGYVHELAAAKKEGVRLEFRLQPKAVVGGDRVTGMTFQVVKPGEGGKLVPVEGAEVTLPAELVVVATGQEKLEAFVKAIPGVGFEKGRVVADKRTGATGHPKVFAGGDCANGAKEVVNAAAEGKVAALGIDAYFQTLSQPQEISVIIK